MESSEVCLHSNNKEEAEEFLVIDDEDNIETPPLPHLMKFMHRKDDNKNLDLLVLMGGDDDGSQLLIPRDIFHLIMSFIPAFPDYFILRFVSSQWLYEFEEHIFARVEYLSLVEDGKPNYYFRVDGSGQKSLVQLKPISLVGRKGQSQCSLSYDEMPNEDTHDESILEVSTNMVLMLFEFLVMVFPNVKHLRLGLSFIDFSHFNPEILLQRLTQLETLDILGIVNYRSRASYNFIEYNQLEMIADSLPSSTKNLNFIGVTFFDMDAVAMVKIFSNKGRSSMTKRKYPPPTVDIQNLSLSYLFVGLGQFNRDDLKSIEEMYLHLEVSVVESTSSTDSLSSPPVEVVSYVDYLNYMSKKEGVVLSHMKMLRRDNDEIIEAVIDIAIREYPYFQPLLSLPAVSEQFQLVSQTKLDVKFVLDANRLYLPKVLEILTDPSRMKYPELVFKMDSTVVERKSTPITLFSGLISECFSEQDFNLIKRIIETYKPSMAVNGVRNYLLETINDRFSLIRTKLMRYLLSVEPELITLGDLDGTINGDQRSFPLIAMLIDQNASLSDSWYQQELHSHRWTEMETQFFTQPVRPWILI